MHPTDNSSETNIQQYITRHCQSSSKRIDTHTQIQIGAATK